MNPSELPVIAIGPLSPDDRIREEVMDNFEKYGMFPRCLACERDCKVPNVPTLVMPLCPRDVS